MKTFYKITILLKEHFLIITLTAFSVDLFLLGVLLLLKLYSAPEVIAALIVTVGGGATFWLTKKKDREAEIRKEKNDVYREFINILVKSITYPNHSDSKIGGAIDNSFLEAINKLAIISSNKVLKKLLYYRDYKIIDSWRKLSDFKYIPSNKSKFEVDLKKEDFGLYVIYDKETGDYQIVAKKRLNGYKVNLLTNEIKYEPGTVYLKHENGGVIYCVSHRNGKLLTGKIDKKEFRFPENEGFSENCIQKLLLQASKTHEIELDLVHIIEGVIDVNRDVHNKEDEFVKNKIEAMFSESPTKRKEISISLVNILREEIGVTKIGEWYKRYPFISAP